jgi:AMP-binding enzyme C-terminal domain
VIWVTGREEDAIPGPGFTIGALEVEAALLGHAAVADAAAVRATSGERRGARALVVPTPRAEPGEDLAEALREHARHAAGVRAVPVEIEFVDALPRTPERKLDRAVLRARTPARPAEPAEASWPEPARLVVPPPRTLESEPPLRLPRPEPDPEPEAQPERGRESEPVQLRAVPEPDSEPQEEAKAEIAPEPETETETETEPEPEPAPKPHRITAPSQSSGLAARLAAYGRQPNNDRDGRD